LVTAQNTTAGGIKRLQHRQFPAHRLRGEPTAATTGRDQKEQNFSLFANSDWAYFFLSIGDINPNSGGTMDAMTRRIAAGLAAVVFSLSATACASSGTSPGTEPSQGAIKNLRFMVPNAPGSGWDTTARTAARALQDAELVGNTEVFNVDGANGTVGLARLAGESGKGDLMMQMGLGLVGSTVTLDSQVKLTDVTPLAKLIEDVEIIFVNADSPYKTIDDLVKDWKADPSGTTIGGGSSPGGADHLVPMLMAEKLGIKSTDVGYTSLGGSGVMPAVLGGQVDFAVTGAGDVVQQVKAGKVRALAVSSEKEFAELPDVPTLKESGVDVTVTNWRGVMAPPGISDEQKDKLVKLLDDMHASPEWQEAVKTNGWVDAYVSGDEFTALIKDQDTAVRKLMSELGL
jgi:putative tricarboxylic transport membrane protein